MSGIITFIVTFLLIYLGAKLFFRYGLPWLIMHYIEKQKDNVMQNPEDIHNERKKEGEINIKSKPRENAKTDKKDFGEYIDFEEIDENEKN